MQTDYTRTPRKRRSRPEERNRHERKMIDHQHIYMTDRSNDVRVADRIKLITLTSTG